jgi:hypothetical protein
MTPYWDGRLFISQGYTAIGVHIKGVHLTWVHLTGAGPIRGQAGAQLGLPLVVVKIVTGDGKLFYKILVLP